MDKQLGQLAHYVAKADSVEGLTRPLLKLLQQITGMESTYLTSIDITAGVQCVELVYNAGSLNFPEGLQVPWGDTLCKRAMDAKQFVTEDVPAIWGDSEAARQLGIKTYISVPVCDYSGNVLGTLCAASAKSLDTPFSAEQQQLLQLCADLISHQLNREKANIAAHARADAAELQLGLVQLLAVISEYCVKAKSLAEALQHIATLMQQSGYWQHLYAATVQADGALVPQSQDDAQLWQSILQHRLYHNTSDNVAQIPADCLLEVAPGLQGQAINVFVAKHRVAIILVLQPFCVAEQDNAALLAGICNALSLLAVRLHEHQQLLELNQQFAYHALHDPLTGLPNRRYLLEELRRYIVQAECQQHSFCLMFVDLDKFKAINDQYGHETGDDFLREFARRLNSCLRKGDFVARQGGDEFVMLCQLATPSTESELVLTQRVRMLCSGEFLLPNALLQYVGPSIGVVTWQSGDSTDVDWLLSQADAAMYRDKQQRRAKAALE